MTTVRDPLSADRSPDRLAYQLGVMLHADDFEDEQTYHRGRLARVLSFLHGSGTAAGLEVAIEGVPSDPTDPTAEPAEPEEVRVHPGLAIDRLGRMVEVPRPACIRVQRWFDALPGDQLALAANGGNRVRADVYLRFAACPRGRTPAFATGPFDALDATAPSRIRDGYELRLVLRTEETPLLPRDPFIDLRAVRADERRNRLERTLLGAWDAAQEEDPSVPATLDRSLQWVFLARIRIPVSSAGPRPLRTADACTLEPNALRLLVYPTASLVSLLGL
jgi:hypothetical protein